MWICHLKWAILIALLLTKTSIGSGAAGTGPAPPPDRTGETIDRLHADHVEVRRSAATQIRLADKTTQRTALPALIDILLHEKDGQVRLAVLDAVTALGPDAVSAIPALLHTLRTNYGGQAKEESHQDYRSAIALAAIGKPAVDGLREILKSERKENIRAEVIMGLGRIGADAATAVPDLIPRLADPSERIRREASLALGRIGSAAVDPLIAASEDKNDVVRAGAIQGLGHLATLNDTAVRALCRAVNDERPEVQAAAVNALAKPAVSDAVVRPIANAGLQHQDERVRVAAVNLLVGRRDLLAQMTPELETLLKAENGGVARHVAYLFGKLGLEAAPRLLEALRHPQSRIEPIALALAQIGSPVVPALSKAVESPDPRVRQGAALALGQIRPLAPTTVARLTAGLNDPVPEVKAAYLAAIQQVGPRAKESVPVVRGLLQDPAAEIRRQAILILAQSAPRDDRLVDDLIGRLDDSDTSVQRQSMDLLRALGPLGRKAVPAVITKLKSPDPQVRLAAAELIGSHGQAAAEAVPALSSLLSDSMPSLRTVAAQTLGNLGRPAQSAFAQLTSLLVDPSFEVREAAALTLGSLELDANMIRPHLARALRDDKSEVRRAASKAIQRQGPRAAIFLPDIILLAGTQTDARSLQRMLRPFERMGPDVRSLPELIELLGHEQESVRLLAIKFLGLAGSNAKAAIPALERLRNDPSTEVRKQAEAACEQIKSAKPRDTTQTQG